MTSREEQTLNLYLPKLTSEDLALLEPEGNTMRFINIAREKFNLDLISAKALADRLRDYFGISRTRPE